MSVGKLAFSGWVLWMTIGFGLLGAVAEVGVPYRFALPGFFLWVMVYPVGGTAVLLFILFGDR